MDLDILNETITPINTTLLTFGNNGAIGLPSGTTAQRPGSAAAGALRWNNQSTILEYFNGTSWLSFGGSVSSIDVSGGTTGLTTSGGPVTSSGVITLAGTLNVANGGTGLSTAPSNGQLLIGNGTGYTQSTLSAGTGIVVANSAGAITITNSNSTTGYVTIGATATTQSTATLLPYAYNIVNATSGGNSVILPAPTAAGQFISIENRTGAVMMIYPSLGAQLENLGTNVGLNSVSQGSYNFVSLSTTQWYLTAEVFASGPGISNTAYSGFSGAILISNTGVLSNLAGTGISVSGATGNVTIANTGVTSIVAGSNISVSGATGAVTISGKGGLLNVQIFTSSGTYTPTTGTNSIIVEIVGGGGAGAGLPAVTAGNTGISSGGGGAAYAKGRFTTGFSGATITIGAGGTSTSGGTGASGGTTSFGALMSAPGGGGAQAGSYYLIASTTSNITTPVFGSSGLPSGGNIVMSPGTCGPPSFSLSGGTSLGGGGGSSVFGAGAYQTGPGVTSQNGNGYGAGGGGRANTGANAAAAGGNGSPGICIIYEYS